MSNNKCLGFIETFGLAACVAAADAAVKSANVRLLEQQSQQVRKQQKQLTVH